MEYVKLLKLVNHTAAIQISKSKGENVFKEDTMDTSEAMDTDINHEVALPEDYYGMPLNAITKVLNMNNDEASTLYLVLSTIESQKGGITLEYLKVSLNNYHRG
jgi:hypothetical protein